MPPLSRCARTHSRMVMEAPLEAEAFLGGLRGSACGTERRFAAANAHTFERVPNSQADKYLKFGV